MLLACEDPALLQEIRKKRMQVDEQSREIKKACYSHAITVAQM